MADDKNKKLNKSNNEQNNTPNRGQSSQVDNLRKLSSQLNNDNGNDKKEAAGKVVKTILISLLVLLLLGGIGVAVYFFTKDPASIMQAGTIKLSTQVTENLKDESGDINLADIEIFPGEKYSVRCVVSNADKTTGDTNTSEYDNILIRYSITIEVDGEKYNNVVVPIITDLSKKSWHTYNPDEEAEDYKWDGYYYYYGSLAKNQRLTLFEEIQFDFHNTLNSFGGKSAQIIIHVEAVHAVVDNLGVEGGDAWNTAPRRWINNMQKGVNNDNEFITI